MARLDVRGQDAVELAIQGGHSELASCLLEQRDPTWHHVSLCNHYPLEVLELAIESGNEQCAKEVLTNKRVVRHLQPGMAARLNLTMRWMQRQISKKRLFNIFTCAGAAVRCNMPGIVEAIDQLNPSETRQAVWYAVCKAQTSGTPAEVDSELVQMANSYLLDKLWPQLSVIVMLRHWELLAAMERSRTRWERLWQSHRDWEAIASNPWTSLPSETMSKILSFLVPSKSSEMKEMEEMRFLVEY
ncbi:unnamed protein product [Phytophthora lilii]|uniref:Unnamed protein product n=1 Tax=Phytophthora lilii TaxID=2077276 RepID=A0A9W6WMX5_9STRA|nr:unnamed protein product [Phytophthora lilii]